jgi:lysophospholipase L1-like esterase
MLAAAAVTAGAAAGCRRAPPNLDSPGTAIVCLSDPRLKADEVHPNDLGHARLAEAVAATVEPLVRQHRRLRGR